MLYLCNLIIPLPVLQYHQEDNENIDMKTTSMTSTLINTREGTLRDVMMYPRLNISSNLNNTECLQKMQAFLGKYRIVSHNIAT
jgi:hypothetical protein